MAVGYSPDTTPVGLGRGEAAGRVPRPRHL